MKRKRIIKPKKPKKSKISKAGSYIYENGSLCLLNVPRPHLKFGTKFRTHRLGTNGGMPLKAVEASVRQNANHTSGRVDSETQRINRTETWWGIIDEAQKWYGKKEKKK